MLCYATSGGIATNTGLMSAKIWKPCLLVLVKRSSQSSSKASEREPPSDTEIANDPVHGLTVGIHQLEPLFGVGDDNAGFDNRLSSSLNDAGLSFEGAAPSSPPGCGVVNDEELAVAAITVSSFLRIHDVMAHSLARDASRLFTCPPRCAPFNNGRGVRGGGRASK